MVPRHGNRLTIIALVLLAVLLCAQLALAILRQPGLIWNEVRWARAVALLRGLTIYPGRVAPGPIIGTLHTPVSHLLYAAAVGWIPNPTMGILAGSFFSVAMVFGAMAWLLIRFKPPGASWTGTLIAFFGCAFATLQSPASYDAVTVIHTDAPALALATIAFGLLCRPGPSRHIIWISAACLVLCVFTKQTMLPLLVAAALFTWIAGGLIALQHFVFAAAIAAILAVSLAVALFSGPAFFFNVLTLSTHRAYKPGAWLYLIGLFRQAKLDSLTALFPLLFFLFYEWRDSRSMISRNRWIVFGFAAVSLIPGTVKAAASIGADLNHVGLVLFFLFVAAALALQHNLAAADPVRRFSAGLFAWLAILVNVTPAAFLELPSAFSQLWKNDSQVAFEFTVHHPHQAYFPLNPAAAILAQGRLNHFDVSLYDRQIAGYPLNPQEVLAGVPPNYQFIALPPGAYLLSEGLVRIAAPFRTIASPELPGWTVYAKP